MSNRWNRRYSKMTYVTFLSALLIVFGPPLALYILVIARSSQLIILSIGRCENFCCFSINSNFDAFSIRVDLTLIFHPIGIFSAFFWILSIMVSSILWFVVIPLREIPVFIIPFAVIFQELVRFGFWKLFEYVSIFQYQIP